MNFVLLINLRLLTIANFLLNMAGHENFSANKYENANFFRSCITLVLDSILFATITKFKTDHRIFKKSWFSFKIIRNV